MVLDCLHWMKEYPSHSNLPETTKIIQVFQTNHIKPKKILLTGMSCSIEYHKVNEHLRKVFGDQVEAAYDGCFQNI